MPPRPQKTKPSALPAIHPDVEWQAEMLAGRVLKKVVSLKDATLELEEIQGDALEEVGETSSPYRSVDARSLIVTHMMNSLLRRGY